jgi:hypothetical protein
LKLNSLQTPAHYELLHVVFWVKEVYDFSYTGDSFHHVTYMHGSLIVFVFSRTINECSIPAAEKLDL